MIVYWSMVLWVPLIYFVYSLSHKEDIMCTDFNIRQGIIKKVPIGYAIVVFGYLIFWIGMRKGVADTGTYIAIFEKIPADFATGWSQINWDGKQPGFDVFNLIFKCYISQDVQWWLMIIAIVCGICIMNVLRKHSVDFFLSAFLFMTMLIFTWMMNGARQFICVAVLFLCCEWIQDGKFVRFLIAILILSTFHITALLMIPIYFVARMKPWSGKIYLFILGIILICIFAEPLFKGMDSALSNTAYSGVSNSIESDSGVNPLRVLFFTIPPVVAFWKNDILEPYYKTNKMLSICINMSLISACLYFVGMFTSGILIGRLPVYSDVYDLLLIPYILHYAFDAKQRKTIMPIYAAILLFYFYNGWHIAYWSDITGYLE